MNRNLLPWLLIFSISFSACSNDQTKNPDQTAQSAPNRTLISSLLQTHTKVLSSDDFQGRAPGGVGEEKTIAYLKREFADLGLQPGNGDSFFQKVPITEITVTNDPVIEISGSHSAQLKYGTEIMVWTRREVDQIEVADSELVFVGYGINAPEKVWNDYAGLDVEGKTVLILVNDPGYATQDESIFNGNAMTYYGRWTYKFEEAARQGAAAAFVIHETDAAGYPWMVVDNSWSGPQFNLQATENSPNICAIEGWIPVDKASSLFESAGLNFENLKARAAQPGFRGTSLRLRASAELNNQLRRFDSNNVIAVLPGNERPDETIIYTAHWDHLGKDDSRKVNQIYNGAVDNASGTAAMLTLARLHADNPIRPKRTIVFLAVTAEESGLLGSEWYATNPIYPLSKTVANINIDGMVLMGRMRDVTVVGFGNSELEEYLERAAEKQDRYLEKEPTPEKGYFYRSDHFNFSKQGVPALFARGGIDSFEYGKEWGLARQTDYIRNRYHKPGDEFNPNWDWEGAVDDVLLYLDVGKELSNESTFPNWHEGNEFRPIRDRSRSSN